VQAPLSVVAKYEEQRSEAGDDAGVKLDRHLLRVLEIPMEQHGNDDVAIRNDRIQLQGMRVTKRHCNDNVGSCWQR
jgi:hypothetical protein